MDQYVRHQLKKTTQQVRVSDLVAGSLSLAAYVLAFFFVVAIIDAWIWPLTPAARLFALATFLIGGAAIAWFMLLPFLFRKVNPQYAAKMIEEAKPEFKNSLLNYLSIRRDKKSTHRAILNEVSKRAATDLSTISPDATVDKSNVIRTGFILVGLVAATVAYAIFSPKSPLPSVMRVLAPGAKISKPAAVMIQEVTPGDADVFFGDRPQVTAKVYGTIPNDEVRLVYSSTDSQIVDAVIAMEKTGPNGTYQAVLSPGSTGIQQPINYRVEAGDGVSPTYSLDVRPNPSVSIESIKVTPPKYTGLPERLIEGNGEIQAVEGAKVEIRAKANLPIDIAYIVPLVAKSDAPENTEYREMRTIQMSPMGDTAVGRLVAALNANRDKQLFSHYKINFRSKSNFRNERPNVYPIRVIADLEPEIEIVEPAQTELTVAVNQPLPVEVWAADLDYEISSIDLHIDHQGNRILDQNLIKKPKGKVAGERVSVRFAITPEDLRLKPGDTAIMFASAADNRVSPTSELSDPNISRTPNYTLIVTDPIENPKQQNNNQQDDPNQEQQEDPNQQDSGNGSPGQQGSEQDNSEQQNEPGARDNSGDQEQSQQSADQDQSSSGGGQQQGENSDQHQSGEQQGSESQPQDSGSSSDPNQSSNGEQSSDGGSQNETGNSSGNQNSDSGTDGNQQRSGNEGEFQNGGSDQERGESASSNAGTDSGTSNDPASSGGTQGANQGGGANGEQQFRDESLTDGESQPLRDNASESEQFERLKEYFENQKDQPNQPSSDSEGGGDQQSSSGDQQGEQGDQRDTSQSSETSDRARNPGDSKQLEPDSGNRSDSETGDSDSERSGGAADESPNPSDQSGSKERAADGNPEQPTSNGAESQNGTPDQSESGSGSRSQPDSQGDQSANPGESGSPDSESTPGEGSQSGSGSESPQGSESQPSSGGGDDSQGNSEAGSASSPSEQSSSEQSQSGNSDNAGDSSSGNGDSQQQGNSNSGESQNERSKGQPSQGAESSDSSAGDNGETGDSGAKSGDPGEGETGDVSKSESHNPSNNSPSKEGGVGGSANGENRADSSDEPTQPDQPNLDYAKKVTDLVLDQLEDQKYEPDPKLLEQMNWSKEDMDQFLKRWKQMRDQAGTGDFKSKREYEDGLRALGIAPKVRGRVADGVKDKEFRLNESGAVDQIPAEYRERFNSYLRRRMRSKRDASGRQR